MNYFYFDQTNQKRGPASEEQLKELAAKGIIGPHTPMETDTGHKGVAGQIPGLFPAQSTAPLPPPPKQLFCTNCASPVPENAAGCMSCGLKPTGHKKFCRQCGAGRTPEQVICTQCGANFGAGFQNAVEKLFTLFTTSANLPLALTEGKFKSLPSRVLLIRGMLIVVFLCLLFIIYGTYFSNSPSTVVKKFYIAIQSQDISTLEKITTLDFFEDINRSLKRGPWKPLPKIKAISHVINGNTAYVTVVCDGGRVDRVSLIYMGRWKISELR